MRLKTQNTLNGRVPFHIPQTVPSGQRVRNGLLQRVQRIHFLVGSTTDSDARRDFALGWPTCDERWESARV